MWPLLTYKPEYRLGQEYNEAKDPNNFDPEIDKTDHDAIAAALPVFCVSSRAFQNLCGRLPHDKFDPTGFRTLEDTEIPSLQEHARILTEEVRASAARRWLHEFGKLILSLIIWAGNDGKQTSMTDSEKEKEKERLKKHLRSVAEVRPVLHPIEKCPRKLTDASSTSTTRSNNASPT